MPQISLLSGVASDAQADLLTQYPVNLIPVPKDTGVSKGYLRSAPGLTQLGTGPGIDRGGINWKDTLYRVMGTKLVSVAEDGTTTDKGDITGTGRVSMDYGPTYLLTVGDGKAWLRDASSNTQITDADLGTVIDGLWVDGYYMFTDGEFLIVTELTNPFSVDPLKYGSSEKDPDRIVGLLKPVSEVYAFNRHTIEAFQNIGGSGFPFQRIESATINKGLVGTHAKCKLGDTFAWVGSGRNEPCSVYVLNGGTAQKIATREVERRLKAYTEAELAGAVLELRADELHQHLMLHLPGETLVCDIAGTLAAGDPVWFFLSTGVEGINPYRARNFVWCYGKWICGDTQDARIGFEDGTVATQYGEVAGWQFDTMWLYNSGARAIVWSLELTGTTGRALVGEDPTVFHSYTVDGLSWSQERTARMGSTGQTSQRVVWRRCGQIRNVRGERFRGANKVPISWLRLESTLEALSG
ncbi:MAG TPA: packaged DNA stabilization protein [Ramlibacter sp.]|uniref:packaged DNA stabilization protein n=1 Tax=Ramlibacter sp. TaxID=1917967 RepID=UPI002D80158B|nr:packaged DNA stabilization protein [Ramlibacter sp.]HET8744311.1 packaged DNA stabilization protein [Ramlibacter sp.]